MIWSKSSKTYFLNHHLDDIGHFIGQIAINPLKFYFDNVTRQLLKKAINTVKITILCRVFGEFQKRHESNIE